MQKSTRGILWALRSVMVLMIFTVGALYFNRRGFYPPHGNPLLYALSTSWLVAYGVAMLITILKASPKLFSLARWEKEGEIYRHTGVPAFRWVLLHSPLGWINSNLYLGPSRTDCKRLLREVNVSELVHWISCFLSSILGISWLAGGYAAYGYTMLLTRVLFDLYPIMLQRWNRGRVCRVSNRQVRTLGG